MDLSHRIDIVSDSRAKAEMLSILCKTIEFFAFSGGGLTLFQPQLPLLTKRRHGLALIVVALAMAMLSARLDPDMPDPIPIRVVIGVTLPLLFGIWLAGKLWDRLKPRRWRNRARTDTRASIPPPASTRNPKQPLRTSPEWRQAWRRAAPGPTQKPSPLRDRIDAARQSCELLLQQLATGNGDAAAQGYADAMQMRVPETVARYLAASQAETGAVFEY